jgi:glycosyltransferase
MKVSIITATFNSASSIRDTLESIRNQSYPDIEHIIIDGGSSDDTLQIIAGYPHVSKIISEKDQGIYDAMNKGIAQASGDIIGILNSDDFYAHHNIIADTLKKIESENADLLYADLEYVDKIKTNKVIRLWKSGKYSEKSFLMGWMPPHPTFFVKKQVYENYGNFNLQLKTSADYEIMLRFMHKYKLKTAYLPQVIVKMRMGGASNKSLRHRLQANREDRLAWQINGLTPYPFTFLFKPMRKIFQFVKRN